MYKLFLAYKIRTVFILLYKERKEKWFINVLQVFVNIIKSKEKLIKWNLQKIIKKKVQRTKELWPLKYLLSFITNQRGNDSVKVKYQIIKRMIRVNGVKQIHRIEFSILSVVIQLSDWLLD